MQLVDVGSKVQWLKSRLCIFNFIPVFSSIHWIGILVRTNSTFFETAVMDVKLPY